MDIEKIKLELPPVEIETINPFGSIKGVLAYIFIPRLFIPRLVIRFTEQLHRLAVGLDAAYDKLNEVVKTSNENIRIADDELKIERANTEELIQLHMTAINLQGRPRLMTILREVKETKRQQVLDKKRADVAEKRIVELEQANKDLHIQLKLLQDKSVSESDNSGPAYSQISSLVSTNDASQAEIKTLRGRVEELMTDVRGANETARSLRTKNANLLSLIKSLRQHSSPALANDQILEVMTADALPSFEVHGDTCANNVEMIPKAITVEWLVAGQLQTIPIPSSLKDMKPWVDKYLAGKVEILPRALREAKKAIYEDVTLVYKALLLLGNYSDMHAYGGVELRQYVEGKSKELRLESALSISNPDSHSTRNDYLVLWRGQQRFLDRALKKGVSRDERHLLRIYYFYDKPSRKIIVGHLPTHLRNQIH